MHEQLELSVPFLTAEESREVLDVDLRLSFMYKAQTDGGKIQI